MKKYFILLIIFMMLISLQNILFAKNSKQKKPGLTLKKNVKTKVVYKKKMEFDFSGDNIEGDYKKPEGFYMVHRAVTEFSEIVKFDLRFNDKVQKSVGYLE
jgi:hypothetical protein